MQFYWLRSIRRHSVSICRFSSSNTNTKNSPFSFAHIGEYVLPEPQLGNQYLHDPVLVRFLRRHLPLKSLKLVEEDLVHFGDRVANDIYLLGRQCELEQPQLRQFDAVGRRVDQLVTGEAWRQQKLISAKEGLVATAYAFPIDHPERFVSRLHQMSKIYLYTPSSGLYGCPLAMTDGAAKVLETELAQSSDRSVSFTESLQRLTSRDPSLFWTSGQWMTEKRGGSDVAGGTETLAIAKSNGYYSLHGYKWFSSATDSDMALALARVAKNRDGSDAVAGSAGLSLFFLETRHKEALNGIQIMRLKDKLGTRQLPTAELLLDGCQALLIGDVGRGVARIADMLTVTRLHTAAACAGSMRRLMNLVRDYATRRSAFKHTLLDLPLHVRTLASLELESRGATLYFLEVVRLFAVYEAGAASERDIHLLRLATPLLKLYTAKQSVALASEAIESFGGLGYLEDSGIPGILRDLQVMPIWEGTTNVLSLDVLRCMDKSSDGVLLALKDEVTDRAKAAATACPTLSAAAERLTHCMTELLSILDMSLEQRSTAARELAFSLARCHVGAILLTEAAFEDATETERATALRWCTRHDLAPLLNALQSNEVSAASTKVDRNMLMEVM